jgi:hypothetical protein
MTTLKEPIKITKQIKDALDITKKTLLFSSNRNWLLIIVNTKVEEKELITKHWSFFKHTTSTDIEYYITEADIMVWNSDKKEWAKLTEIGINLLLSYENPIKMKNTFLNSIKAPLENLGVTFYIKNNLFNK